MTDANFDIVEKLEAFVTARGHTMTDLAFSWLAARAPVASIIAGATKPEQIEANVKATGWTLTADDMAEIDKLTAR
jgi:aryl-alcohol dehydrogenase-like predicted oxidoreductase